MEDTCWIGSAECLSSRGLQDFSFLLCPHGWQRLKEPRKACLPFSASPGQGVMLVELSCDNMPWVEGRKTDTGRALQAPVRGTSLVEKQESGGERERLLIVRMAGKTSWKWWHGVPFAATAADGRQLHTRIRWTFVQIACRLASTQAFC